jgi:hypothetical protein
MGFKTLCVASLAAAALCLISSGLAQVQDIRTERVRFPPGATGTTIEGRITGYEIVDYKLGARAGQTMTVKMTTDGGANHFNLMAPGETEVAFFNGSLGDNAYTGRLPESGDYTIRLYQMRSAARRGATANYTLTVEIMAGDPGESGGVESTQTDALVPGTEFHATGKIPCARTGGQPTIECEFGVVRNGDGSGYVKVFWPNGGNRVLFFEDGAPVTFDWSEADGDATMTVDKEVDLYRVRIGDQRFKIPEAVLLGG